MKRAPLMAAIIMMGLTVPVAAWAQLPQTNMGKFVHKPGDNQYDKQSQLERHPVAPPPVQRFQSSGGNGGGYVYRPRPKPRKPDPSIEPIAADEPVPSAGFPVLPDRLDLPIAMGTWGGASPPGGGGGGGNWGGPSGGGGSAADGPPRMGAKKQGYQHYDAGAFIPKEKKSGYYKCNEVPRPNSGVQSDQISTAGGAGMGMGAGGGMRMGGKEPKLNDREDGANAPEAPQPVVINQSTTQDLSLPEDDFVAGQSAKSNRPSKAGRTIKNIGRRAISPVRGAAMRYARIPRF